MDVLSTAITQDVVVGVLLATAVVTDLRSRRIPNLLTFGVMTLGLVLALVTATPLKALLGIVAAFIPGFLLWRVGGTMRAGDAKLFMAMGAVVGPVEVLRVLLFTFLVNIPVALVQLARAGRLRTLPAVIRSGVRKDPDGPAPLTAPFAAVIALGYLVARLVPWLGGGA